MIFLSFQRTSFIPSLMSFILYVDPSVWLVSFSFSLRNFFQHFLQYKAGVNEFPQFMLEKVLFLFYFWRVIMLYTECCTGSLKFKYLKHFPFFSCWHGFKWEVHCNSYPCSLIGKVLPIFTHPFPFFKSPFCLIFCDLNMTCLCVCLLILSYSMYLKLLGYVFGCLPVILESSQPVLLQYFLFSIL